jgi:hypothetical protein
MEMKGENDRHTQRSAPRSRWELTGACRLKLKPGLAHGAVQLESISRNKLERMFRGFQL